MIMNEYFMPIYTTLIGVIIGSLVAWIKNLSKKRKTEQEIENGLIDALKDGMAILLKKQLFEYYEMYEFRESIPINEWEEIENTHKTYKRLGGNNSGDRVYEEMRQKRLGNG